MKRWVEALEDHFEPIISVFQDDKRSGSVPSISTPTLMQKGESDSASASKLDFSNSTSIRSYLS